MSGSLEAPETPVPTPESDLSSSQDIHCFPLLDPQCRDQHKVPNRILLSEQKNQETQPEDSKQKSHILTPLITESIFSPQGTKMPCYACKGGISSVVFTALSICGMTH